MKVEREYSLAEVAVKLQRPIEAIMSAKSLACIYPTRRDAAGQPFFDQKALSLFHRLLIENDGAVLLEPKDHAAYLRYMKSQGCELQTRPLTADEQAFTDALLSANDAGNDAEVERLLDTICKL